MHDEHDVVVWKENVQRQAWWESILGLAPEARSITIVPPLDADDVAAA